MGCIKSLKGVTHCPLVSIGTVISLVSQALLKGVAWLSRLNADIIIKICHSLTTIQDTPQLKKVHQ